MFIRNKILFILLLGLLGMAAKAQTFPNTDSLRSYIDKYIRNSAIPAFQNLRLNTALKALADRTDTVEAKITGGVRVVDSIWAPNDSTLYYKIKSIIYHLNLGGGGGAGEIVSASYGLTKSGTVLKADTSKLSTVNAVRDTAIALRLAIGTGGGEVGSAGYGLFKVGTTYSVDTATLTKTLYVDSNTLAGNGTLASPLYVIGGGGGSMDTLPLAHRGTPNTYLSTNTFSATTNPFKMTGTGGLNPKILTANFDTYGAPIWQVNSGTPALGHNSPGMWLQNTNAGSSSMLGFLNNFNEYSGEVGSSNLDSSFHVLGNWPVKQLTEGLHLISDGTHLTWHAPLTRYERDGSIKFVNQDEATLSVAWNAKFDLANKAFIFGDTTNSSYGANLFRIQSKGNILLNDVGPYTAYHASGVTQPFTFSGATSAKLAGRTGVLHGSWGGLYFQGWSQGDNEPLVIDGNIGSASPTKAAISLATWKTNGADGRTALTGTNPALRVFTGSFDGTGTKIFELLANGSTTINGSLTFKQSNDDFLSSNNSLGVHSNGYAYFQGNTGGFIIANNNLRMEQLQLRTVEHSFYLFTNNTERIRIDSNGVLVLNNLVGTGTRIVTATSNGQVGTGAALSDVIVATGSQTMTGQKTINSLIVNQLKGTGTTPTIAAGSGAGTGASVAVALGHDFSFRLLMTAGSSPAAAGSVIATVTLNGTLGGANPLVSWAARNQSTAGFPFYFETTSNTVVIKAGSVVVDGTSYSLDITVIDY